MCEHETFFDNAPCAQCGPKQDRYKNKNKMEWVAIPDAPTIDPMLALEEDKGKARFPARVELKYDGIRAIITRLGNGVRIQSRGGHDFTRRYPSLAAHALKTLPVGVYDGELYFPSRRGEKETLRYKNQHLIRYAIYDLPMLWKAPLKIRRLFLENLGISEGRIHLAEGYVVTNMKQADRIVGAWLVAGFEGGVIKPLDSLYWMGKRTDWVKIKTLTISDPAVRAAGIALGLKKMSEEFA